MPHETPLIATIVAGIAFAYFVVLPAAISFLLNFNEADFNTQLRAKEYYGFLGIMVVLLGLLFQMPIALLSLCRLGVVTPEQLAHNRRYAIFFLSIIAAAAKCISTQPLCLKTSGASAFSTICLATISAGAPVSAFPGACP